jgi:large subunit ribosomal protein L24
MIFEKNRVVVEGLNMMKKHVRPNPQAGIQGGIVEKEAPMDISNVALFNPKTGKADKVGIKLQEDGKRVRFFKSNGELVD